MRSKIVWKLSACFSIALILFAILTGSVFLLLFRQHTTNLHRTDMEKRAGEIASTFSQIPTPGLGHRESHGNVDNGYAAFMRFLYEMSSADVWVVNTERQLSTYGHGHHGQINYEGLPDGAEHIVGRVLDGEETYSEEFSQVLNVPTLTVGAPIFKKGKVIGAVLLHSPVSGVEEAIAQGVLALTCGIGIALVVALIVSGVLSYFFTRPLNRMNQTALCLSNGDYLVKTGVSQNDEIGELAHTLDHLAGRLEWIAYQQEALEQMREDFVANVSHELRTPVTVLRGSLEVLRDGTVDDPEEVKEYFEQMLNESFHMERLVNDLLELSRLQNANFQLNFSQLNLTEVLQDVARAMRRSAQEKKVQIDLENAEQECMIEGDYNRVRQMLIVVVDNAVKFSTSGGKVEICLIEHAHGFEISVIDYGCGIDSKDLPRVFERFHKTLSPENPNGTGLGLAIAKQIADRHNVQLWVESEPRVRTVFHFIFPKLLKTPQTKIR